MAAQLPEPKPLQQMCITRRADPGAAGDAAQGGFKLIKQLQRRIRSILLEQECYRGVEVPVRFRPDMKTKQPHTRLRPSALRLRAQ